MAKNIEVYFKNENDAESAQSQLRTLKVHNMYIEEMPEDMNTALLVPLSSANINQTTGGATGSTGSTGIGGSIASIIPKVNDTDKGPDYLSHMLHVEVEKADYDQVVSILKDHNCYGHQEY